MVLLDAQEAISAKQAPLLPEHLILILPIVRIRISDANANCLLRNLEIKTITSMCSDFLVVLEILICAFK